MPSKFLKIKKTAFSMPEMLNIGHILSLPHLQAFGMCVYLMAWYEDNVREGGIVPGCDDKSIIDKLLKCDGFADALETVGWLRMRDGGLELTLFVRQD